MTSTAQKIGIGALIGGGVALLVALFIAALLIVPFIFWLAWNVLGLGPSMGLPELGFWSIVLASVFLIVGWFGKTVITAVVFIVDPAWLHDAALVSWPEPSFRNFVAILLLAILASRPHAQAHRSHQKRGDAKGTKSGDGPWTTVATEIRDSITKEITDQEGSGS